MPRPAPSPIRTTCPYCGVGCGVLATPDGSGGMQVRGDPDHRANFGRLCSKGSALGETVSHEGRLTKPLIDGQPSDWDTALSCVARRFQDTIANHGPDSVAFYVSGQLLTEDYYVANKLMKGFIGSANIDTNSRLCMASSVAGHKRAFGTDTVPGLYADLEKADLIVLVGSNLAWCHPVLYQRIVAAKADRPGLKIVNIDPRHTASSDLAELHLSLAPGSDVALFNGLLAEIAARGAIDRAYVDAHVSGLDAALAAAEAGDAKITGLSRGALEAFYDLWIGTPNVVTIYSQGVNQSSAGTDKVNAILNCHLATGRIGRAGMGPFSVTGQPNAMGGREVGGLANMLACHLDLEDPAHRYAVRTFWDAPLIPDRPGLKAVDMFQAVSDGRVKALWIMCTNPAVSMPEANAVRDAIAACEFTVVSDLTATTDTARLADIVLPATGWGEKSGTVTNSERCISRQRAVIPAPKGARADWRIICDVAQKMGFGEAFAYDGPAAIFREHAALSGIAAALDRDFDISALATISDQAYDDLDPTVWPLTDARQGGRFFAEGGFFTPDGRARMLPLAYRAPATALSQIYPLRLNTGRVRDHWHTMTRTGRSPRLSQHMAEPFLEIHPQDAIAAGVAAADLAEIQSPLGKVVLRIVVTDRVARGSVFAPMHWTGEFASAGRVDVLVAAETDPISGQPESKATPVAVRRFSGAWYGFAVSRVDTTPDTAYWSKARIETGWRLELADTIRPEIGWVDYARSLFGAGEASAVTFEDTSRGLARIALVEGDRLVAALFVGPAPVAVARNHVVAGFASGMSAKDLLAARAGADHADPGATICSCFNVGVNTIVSAVRDEGMITVEQIGKALSAGTNCGSCRPEIHALIATHRRREAAE
ncbi:MAG: molybdopterin-dependent oxidoreductase [Pseudomonadota bacterium]